MCWVYLRPHDRQTSTRRKSEFLVLAKTEFSVNRCAANHSLGFDCGRMADWSPPPRQYSKGVTFFGGWVARILRNRPHRRFPAPDTRGIINGITFYCSRSISGVIRYFRRISEPNPSKYTAGTVGTHLPGGPDAADLADSSSLHDPQ